ncbi:MAG: restriction endonuclease subunit S [Lactobacillus amylovorus]
MKTNTLDFDAQALRDKILDLAMRGKLVPQDPNDEPASVLLEKIKAEKAELVKEKKIKKSKPLPEITDDEKPFDIPDSWEWVRIDTFNTYNGHSVHPDKNPNELFELYSVPIYENKHPEEVAGKKIKSNKQSVKLDDILLCKINPRINRVWKVGSFTKYKSIASTEWIVIRQKYIVSNYLRYAFMSPYFRELLQSEVSGVGGSLTRAKPKIVKNYIVPLPPLSEQSRIAAKIAQLFALLRKVETSTQQYAKLQTLLKSKVLDLAMRGKLVKQDPNDEPASELLKKIKAEKAELIKEKKIKKSKPLPPITDEEKPFDIPDSWEWVRLESVCDEIGDIDHKMPRKTINGQYLYISPKDFTKNGIDYDHAKRISEDDFKKLSQKFLPKKGDLIFPRYGTIGIIRKINTERPVLVSYSCCLIRSNKNMSNDFIQYELKSKITKKEIDKYVNRSTQPNVGLKSIKSFLFPLPPLEEQKRIVSKIIELFSLL